MAKHWGQEEFFHIQRTERSLLGLAGVCEEGICDVFSWMLFIAAELWVSPHCYPSIATQHSFPYSQYYTSF